MPETATATKIETLAKPEPQAGTAGRGYGDTVVDIKTAEAEAGTVVGTGAGSRAAAQTNKSNEYIFMCSL